MRRQRTQKKSKLQMGIEPMTFRTLVGRSTTEPWELILELRFFPSSLSPHIFVYLIFYNDRPVRIIRSNKNR